MFGGDLPTAKDKEGAYFIEGNGQLFRFVLDFLRRNELCLPEDFKEHKLLRLEADFYQIRPLIDALNLAPPVALNVGGVPYTTSLSILTKYPDSALGRMFSGGLPISKDEDGAYRIERNGRLFGFILDFLRSNELGLPDDFEELEFTPVDPLAPIRDLQFELTITAPVSFFGCM